VFRHGSNYSTTISSAEVGYSCSLMPMFGKNHQRRPPPLFHLGTGTVRVQQVSEFDSCKLPFVPLNSIFSAR